MKIIQTPARFPPHTGGVEQYTYILSKKLVEQGHEVTVLCANEPEQAATRTTYEGIDVVRIDDIGKIAQTNLTPRLPVELHRAVRDADLVHTHLPTPWTADVSVVIAKLHGVPSVVTYHNDIRGDGLTSYIASAYNTTAMQVTLSLTDRIITTQESYFDGSNIPQRCKKKVVTIRNGVDIERFKPMDIGDEMAREFGFETDSTNLFFLSVLDEYHDYKGLENLLESMQDLPPDYHLVVGGDGSKRDYYERVSVDLGVDSQVNFVGYISNENLPKYYNLSDVFVLPSTSAVQEGFGLVLLEALACGTPVVTTDVVGVAEQVARRNVGTVIPQSSPQRIRDALSGVSSTDEDFHTEQARELCVDQYSWEEITNRVEELYTQMII